MKVWKFAAIVSIVLSSMLSALICKIMLTGEKKFNHLASSSLSSSSPAAAATRRQQRYRRATDNHPLRINQYRALFESYTEGEIKELVATLIERFKQSGNSGESELNQLQNPGGRIKRARIRHKPCSIKELEVSVTELGLGYESDETVLFRYCSGTCDAAVRNYDMSLKNMRTKRKIKKEKVRARPCCRPLSYDDDVSFLDVNNRYHTIKELSARECGCV